MAKMCSIWYKALRPGQARPQLVDILSFFLFCVIDRYEHGVYELAQRCPPEQCGLARDANISPPDYVIKSILKFLMRFFLTIIMNEIASDATLLSNGTRVGS